MTNADVFLPIAYWTNEADDHVFGGCDHRHRTPAAAKRCLERAQRSYRRIGGGAYCPWRTVAVYSDGRQVTPHGFDD